LRTSEYSQCHPLVLVSAAIRIGFTKYFERVDQEKSFILEAFGLEDASTVKLEG